MMGAKRMSTMKKIKKFILELEVGTAFVDSGSTTLSKREILDFVAERAVRFKVPTHVHFVSREQRPHVASGEVPKYRLRELAMKLLAEREEKVVG
jgi:fatty-acyl-CoA synthase